MPGSIATAINDYGRAFFCTFDASLSPTGLIDAERRVSTRQMPTRSVDYVALVDEMRAISRIEWLP
jgi:hypothetical protein